MFTHVSEALRPRVRPPARTRPHPVSPYWLGTTHAFRSSPLQNQGGVLHGGATASSSGRTDFFVDWPNQYVCRGPHDHAGGQ